MKYIVRMLCYIAKMVVILGMVFLILSLTGTLDVEPGQFAGTLFKSDRGMILMGALLLLSAVYPRLAFTTVDIRGNMQDDREALVNAFASCGYSLSRENDRRMVFRANGFGKRLATQWCDAITVTADGNFISMEGMKKEIVRIEARFRALNNM